MSAHAMQPAVSPTCPPDTTQLDTLRARARALGRSARTEQAYVYWARHFICQHRGSPQSAPGSRDLDRFMTGLEYHWRISRSSRQQARSALRFFYREVLGITLPGVRGAALSPPTQPNRLAA